MQEKDIKRKLNQELDEMAPDILDRILAQPIEKIESEKELFGKDKPLFKEKKSIKRFLYAPAITAIAACFVMVIFLMQSGFNTTTAFSIVIDVNPSITIEVDEDGNVEKIVAGNKDAKKIVKKVNEEIDEGDSYEKVLRKVVKHLNKEGYLKKKDKAMLLSVVSENEDNVQDKIVDVKEKTENYTEEKNIKCKPVYQSCVVTDEVKEVAEKNDVSVGKAAFAMKIAKKENEDVDKMCHETVDVLVEHAENSGLTVDNIVVEETTALDESTSETTSGEFETTDEFYTGETIEGETTTANEFETTTGPNGETPAIEITTAGEDYTTQLETTSPSGQQLLP